jgi:predicted nucleic acid-binding protein
VPSGPHPKIRKGVRPQLLPLLRNNSHLVVPRRRLEVSDDPGDNMLLECADAGGADYLITGNQRHFPNFWKRSRSSRPAIVRMRSITKTQPWF